MTAAAETAHLTCHTSGNVSYKQAVVLTEAVMDVSLHFIRIGHHDRLEAKRQHQNKATSTQDGIGAFYNQ